MSDCVNCIYAVPTISDVEEEGPLLKCHRYPPVLFVLEGEVTQGWPDAVERCGEYREAL